MIVETGRVGRRHPAELGLHHPLAQGARPTGLEEGARAVGRSLSDLDMMGGRRVLITEDPRGAERAKDTFRRNTSATYFRVDYHKQLLADVGFAKKWRRALRPLMAGDTEAARQGRQRPYGGCLHHHRRR